MTTDATEISLNKEALSGIDVDIESSSYVVLSEDGEELQVAVPVITTEDKSGTSTTHITRRTGLTLIVAVVLCVWISICDW